MQLTCAMFISPECYIVKTLQNAKTRSPEEVSGKA